ncbi:hypothetical protein CI102_9385 [Trichoderma harzianum]|uniref:Uncharacterized protein n=1 Tax=Trichoderma harzianum CBS 226.95 TaxID=983964 RepID=A0A2T4AJP5_TRIHA|nr:hypothetical protein M431DRAFT_547516 [Trichoderma harzianum CBS 226.95]PKK47655.1 hypothetical protein CI102_9385 [Trichoderma harzianum]PTB57252.1 hypothetical protein M431DRAFT_547516 [Trichoderma harzianum CBS 226.95]
MQKVHWILHMDCCSERRLVMHRTIQFCSISIDGHGPARPASWRARKNTVALITATPGLDASTRDRWDCIGAARSSPVGIHGRIEVASVLRCIQGISLQIQRTQQGREPCLALPWYSCQHHHTAGTLGTCTCSCTYSTRTLFRLGAGTWKHAVEQGTGFLVPARLASPNCLASPAKSTSDDLLDRLPTACSTIRIASSHRVRYTVTSDGIVLQTDRRLEKLHA